MIESGLVTALGKASLYQLIDAVLVGSAYLQDAVVIETLEYDYIYLQFLDEPIENFYEFIQSQAQTEVSNQRMQQHSWDQSGNRKCISNGSQQVVPVVREK